MPGSTTRRLWVRGPIIVGAGPSGLAVAACLKEKGIPSLMLQRANCIASLWQLKTYYRLRLHLPKQFCQLPIMPFPSDFPTYPTKQKFLDYLMAYTHRFDLKPVFNNRVVSARFDHRSGLWQVKAATVAGSKGKEDDAEVVMTEYVSQWLVVATGENAQEAVPEIQGIGGSCHELVCLQFLLRSPFDQKENSSRNESNLDIFSELIRRNSIFIPKRKNKGREFGEILDSRE